MSESVLNSIRREVVEVRFEGYTTATVKDVTPCNLVYVSLNLGGT
jgi:hypothetical protein